MSPTTQTDFPGVALVTGAGGTGIGAAVARAFAQSGCTKLVVTDYNATTLSQITESLRQSHQSLQILSVAGDISSSSFIDDLFSQIEKTFGRLDYAVNCAGISGNNAPSFESTVEDFDRINGVNYRGLWMCSKKELEIMKGQDLLPKDGGDELRRQRGSIVNIASQLGVVGRTDAPIYCASKSAVIGLTRADAMDASPYLIRVNALCPGIIRTAMTDHSLRPPLPEGEKDMTAPMELTKEINMAPMRRMGSPEEMADIVLFLASEKASFVQGAAWVADGGYTIN
ncbi:hypothetical protein CI109_101093 [Kwoniella shandongensis]|uniref:Uncharacterized protein n=1 Tax=Kwoniella shandongensis TaxID=1734106 RepID=A0A5M6C9T0_9TREE|nr:uncharacterized protein CI109_001561 [Kwoniella shandongensis]KAA5530155.1 hypothetical protein CI109_001561 [Kwoniella shandongensis]